VRVEASRLERLMDLLAELVMLRNRRETYVDSMRTIQRELNYCSARTRTLTSTVGIATPATRATFEDFNADTRRDADLHPYAACEQSEQITSKSRLLSRTLDEISKDTAELGRSLQDVVEPLAADNSAVSHLIGRFRQELMELRRLPIGGLFQRLQRVIRDAAKTEGKLVEVHVEGQGARAERAVQDRLFEPMLHLVRNAVSHGIDVPEARTKREKVQQERSHCPPGPMPQRCVSRCATMGVA
jgi:chemosensory pili system protein ChpA (sensor histidine kinase/response regulator)